MRTCAKRGLSLLLALVMCVSLLSGLVFTGTAATVTYKTGNADGFSNVILNWGSRGTLATFLSPNAIDFYQDNHTSYAELSALSGSSNTSSVPNSPLYKELAELMKDNHKIITTYNQTRDLYRFTDCQNSSNTAKGSISSFYTGIGIGPDWDGGATWNREHTWPNSKGLNGSDENDIMMLRPTSKSENSARGNKAYGESSSYFNPDSDSNGKYHLRGDVARTMLYVYVRWGNTNLWGTDGVIENKEILLKWMKEDPVDTWE
ncbi:MAG: endonuclease, partial [Oscillospiraceae bacterium]|nr:endonuclease [Oscillospiraceae bacterium]